MHPKTCMVPSCLNTSRNSSKIFLRINMNLAAKWCLAAEIHYNPKKQLYCCEDHIELQDAVENYHYWKMMGVRPRLNKNYVPSFSKENYAPDHLQTENEVSLPRGILREQNTTVKDTCNKAIQCKPATIDNAIQCKPETVGNAIQCKASTKDKTTNYRCKNIKYNKANKKPLVIDETSSLENVDIGIEYRPSSCGSTTEMEEQTGAIIQTDLRACMLDLIKTYPKMYIGIPKPFYTIIQYISKEYNVEALHIIITLYKIKQNDTFVKMSHQFQISRQQMSTFFPNTIQVLANFFQNFIYFSDLKCTKKNLPLVFKIRFSNVQTILDCFEIEIQKPSDPHMQSRTWSQYKNCNTVKYLVGCTPDGFINFISQGYGGRTSDKAIVELSDLIDQLPVNAVIMADRGFKAVESILATKNITLLRPPSVYAGSQPDKQEVLKTKVIASLRVHVERLIRRLREFNMLKPHSVITHKHLGYIDEIVIIACGLCNLQKKIIKDK